MPTIVFRLSRPISVECVDTGQVTVDDEDDDDDAGDGSKADDDEYDADAPYTRSSSGNGKTNFLPKELTAKIINV